MSDRKPKKYTSQDAFFAASLFVAQNTDRLNDLPLKEIQGIVEKELPDHFINENTLRKILSLAGVNVVHRRRNKSRSETITVKRIRVVGKILKQLVADIEEATGMDPNELLSKKAGYAIRALQNGHYDQLEEIFASWGGDRYPRSMGGFASTTQESLFPDPDDDDDATH